MPTFTEGEIRVNNGAIFASSTIVRIKIIGHGGHGSAPHKTIDPINASAFILTALFLIPKKSLLLIVLYFFYLWNTETPK